MRPVTSRDAGDAVEAVPVPGQDAGRAVAGQSFSAGIFFYRK